MNEYYILYLRKSDREAYDVFNDKDERVGSIVLDPDGFLVCDDFNFKNVIRIKTDSRTKTHLNFKEREGVIDLAMSALNKKIHKKSKKDRFWFEIYDGDKKIYWEDFTKTDSDKIDILMDQISSLTNEMNNLKNNLRNIT